MIGCIALALVFGLISSKAACILQTLVFAQKPEMGYTKEQEDGSVVVHVKKQYNDKTDVSEYFS